MKYFAGIFIVFLFFSSCNSFGEKEIKNEVYSNDFNEFKSQDNLEIIDLDLFEKFSEIRKEMELISCRNKVSGLRFSLNQNNYYLVGFADCPENNEIACYFTPNKILIKNDSIIEYGSKATKPIDYLKTKLDTIISSKYNFRFRENKVKPAIIRLYIEDRYPISKTKKVLKEIVEQFIRVNSKKIPGYFEYSILFESISWSDIPPPPPIDVK